MDKEMMTEPTAEQTIMPESDTNIAPTPEPVAEAVAPETSGANDAIVAKISEYMPEADLSTPEAILTAADELLGKLIIFQNKLRDAVKVNPALGGFLLDLSETADIALAINNNFEKLEKEALLEDLEDGMYDEAKTNFSTKVAGMKAHESELEENRKQSEISAKSFTDRMKISEDDLDGFIEYYQTFLADALNNKMTEERWETLWQAYKYKSDMAEKEGQVAEAEENGKVIGRNEKIVASKLSKEKEAELLPVASGGATKAPMTKPSPMLKPKTEFRV